MTVSSTTRRAGPYPGNGLATSFPFDFKVFAKTDIAVVFANSLGVESTLVLDSDYSVTLNADQNANPGGSIAYPIIGSPMTATQALAIVGGLDYSQTSALPTGGAYNATIVERALDRITILTQQLRETVNRGVQLAFTTAANVSSRLPAPRGGSVLGWAADGLSLTNLDAAGLGVSVNYANWRTQTFNGTGAQVAFVLTVDAGVASNCDVVVGGVAQTPDINYSYDALSKTLTFLTGAPPVGTNNVVVRYGQALPQGAVASGNISDSTTTGRAVLTAANAAAARTALVAAESGVNSSITSLTGLTSPIPRANTLSKIESLPDPTLSANAMTLPASTHALDFRSITLGSGLTTTVSGTAAALVIPAGATLGTTSGQQSTIVEVVINNAGTLEKAVVNLAGGSDLSETGVISTTAISAAATAANVFYSTAARTNVAYRAVRTITSTQATAGQWATALSLVQGQGGQALAAMSSAGYGQTHQNVTGSRALSTTYYNTTGKPIFAIVAVTWSNAAGITITINGVSSGANPSNVSQTSPAVVSFLIPPGASYSVTAGTVQTWTEIR